MHLIPENAYFPPCHWHNSFSFDQIFLSLTYKMELKLGEQLDHEMIQCILFCGSSAPNFHKVMYMLRIMSSRLMIVIDIE